MDERAAEIQNIFCQTAKQYFRRKAAPAGSPHGKADQGRYFEKTNGRGEKVIGFDDLDGKAYIEHRSV